jgi:riboflavin synthase
VFSGLVEATGRIVDVEERPHGRRFWIEAPSVVSGEKVGDSLSVNGCCLTMVTIDGGRAAVEAVPETLARTTLGAWRTGRAVNLERAMRLDQRLGGHLVQGHVDGVGTIGSVTPEGDGTRIAIELPAALARFVAEKGSLAVDGVSLTVARASGARCEIALIPHTLAVTVAGAYAAGDPVNLEVDLIARYLARLLEDTGTIGRPA